MEENDLGRTSRILSCTKFEILFKHPSQEWNWNKSLEFGGKSELDI